MVRQTISKLSVSREVSASERQCLIATLFWFGIAGGLAVRILPWLRGLLPFNPGDPARYYMATLNVFDSGSIEATPFYESVYDQVSLLLNWPGFHILQSVLAQVSSVDLHTDLILFFIGNGLVSGALLATAGYLLGESLFDRRVGLISAVAILYLNQGIYYQSEYHAQGLGVGLVMFAIAAYIKSYRVQSSRVGYRVVAIIAFAAATISHHFSSYMLIPFGAAFLSVRILPYFHKQSRGTHALIVIVLITLYSVYFANDFITLIASKLDNFAPSSLSVAVGTGDARPLQAQLKLFSRIPFGLLILLSLLSMWRERNFPMSRLVMLVFAALIAVSGVGMSTLLGAPINRALLFFETILLPFAVHGAVLGSKALSVQRAFQYALLVAVLSLNLVSAFPLQYWGAKGKQNSYYWYSGRAISWDHASSSTSFLEKNLGELSGELILKEGDPFYNAAFIGLKLEDNYLVHLDFDRSVLDALQRKKAQFAIVDVQDHETQEEIVQASAVWSIVYADGLAELLQNPRYK